MNVIKNIILELQKIDAQVSVEGGNLRIDTGKGMISDRLKMLIRTHKAELIDYITQVRESDFSLIPALAEQPAYELSSSQSRLWVLSQMEEVNLTFNIPTAYCFEGPLDTDALDYSFLALIQRHEVLRTVFHEEANGDIKQVVRTVDETGFQLEHHDLRGEEGRKEKLKALVQGHATAPFNAGSGPLMRAALYRVEEEQWILSYVMHHIISDGWSMGVVIKDLLQFYQARTQGVESPLEPLRIHYKDYAAWQRQQLQQEITSAHRSYWMKQFSGRLPVLDLKGDRERPSVQTFRGGMISTTIDAELTASLRQLSQEQGGTLFMGLLASVNILLHRSTGAEDMIIGTPIAGRQHADLNDQIGFYINTLALRTRFRATDTYKKLFDGIRQVTLDAYEHQSYPFDELVNDLQLRRDASRSALFDVMILLQNFNESSAAGSQSGEVSVKKYEDTEHTVSKYDLSFYFAETEEGLRADIEYNSDLFDAETVTAAADRLQKIMKAIVADPAATVEELVVAGMDNAPLPVTLGAEETAESACSHHQKRLWFIDQFEKNYLYEGSPVYHNLPLLVQLPEQVEAEVLHRAVLDTVKRHAVLRTRVLTQNSQPLCITSEEAGPGLQVRNWEETSRAGAMEQCLQLIGRPFDMEAEPLVRFDLLCCSDGQIFLLTVHHLIADRRSLQLLFDEVMSRYEALLSGNTEEPAAAINSYGKFAAWQNALTDRDLEAQSFYWKRKLKDAPVLYLDSDRQREHIHIYEAGLCSGRLPAGLPEKIELFCSGKGVPASVFYIAAFKALLYRYSGSTEIVIGTLHAHRRQQELENMIGPLANLVTLRTSVSEGLGFDALLRQVDADVSRSAESGTIPFEKVVLDVNPSKDMSRTALFDVLVHYEQQESNAYDRVELNLGLGKYDLNLLVKQEAEGCGVYLTFNKKYFDASRMERFLGYYTGLLAGALNAPSLPLSRIDYLGIAEKQKLVSEFNDHTAAYPKEATINSLFEAQAAATPGNIAVAFEEKELSYKELNEKANKLAHYIRNNYTIHPDDLVAVQLERSEKMIIALLAVLKSGAAYVPIDPAYPQERIDYMISDSNCKLVIDAALLKKFYDEEERYSMDNPSTLHLSPSSLAYVIYTSGTTGKPKGSLIEHRNVVRLFKTDSPLFDFNEKDVWTVFHSFCFDFSVWEMYGALLFGGKTVVVSKAVAQDTAAYRKLLLQHGVTVLNQTPSAFYNLIREELEGEASGLQLRYVIFGGEALSPGRLKEWKEKYPGTELINMYGITETTVHVTYKKLSDEDIAADSSNIGSPIPTLTCYVLDGNQQLLPIGVSGELYVGGEGVCRGYLNRPELTAQKFIQSPFRKGERLYRTGDKAKLLENGELEYGGRIDEQVKIRGYRIELGEVESALRRNEKIEDVVVIARNDGQGEKNLVAYVSGREQFKANELRTALSELLPSYMIPAYFVQLDTLPLTSNGKVNKKALPEPEGLGMNTGVEYVAPRNETEQKLAAIWQDILGREGVGVKDNFFDLGGHSLKATRLASRMHREFEVKVELKDLFTHMTLEEQAELVAQSQKSSFASIAPVAEQTDYPVSSPQHRLWVLSQFEDGSIAYNMPGAYVFEGALDLDAFSWSLLALLERHESLRTVFRQDSEGGLRQLVRPAQDSGFELLLQDLRSEEQREQKVRALIQQDFLRPFNLVSGPLLRAALYRMEENQWVFGYVLHHIVGDGWSLQILMRELLLLYNSRVQGTGYPLKPLRVQYKDYAAWQQEQLSGESLLRHKNYWLDQFGGELPVLELAADRPRPSVKSYRGAVVSRRFGSETNKALKALAQQQDATLYMGLLAAVNLLLYRYTGQEDLIVGSPIAGRQHADLEDQIGFYVNMLALRTRLQGSDSFEQLLSKVKKGTLEAYEHQVYPFDELVEEVHLTGDTSRHALFDVVVVLQNTEIAGKLAATELEQVKLRAYDENKRVVSLFDLRFDFQEMDGELFLGLEYNSDIYNRDRIERMADNLHQLFYSILDQPARSIAQLDYISGREKLLLSVAGAPASYPAHATIVSLFEEQVERTPHHTALSFEGQTLSYAELNNRANRVAHFLLNERGLKKGEGAGILLSRNPECVIAILGILKAGGVYIPMETDTPEDRLRFVIRDTKMRVIITEKALIELLNRLQWSCPSLEAYLCVDSTAVHEEKEREENIMMSQELWDHVGEKAVDQITGGGWSSSFTGGAIPEEEMEEYAMNAYRKLAGLLHSDMRVLEIGCSSGLTLSKIAPQVELYYGTDMSPVILENTRQMVERTGLANVKLECMVAHEINRIEKGFDLIIINSVIQHFHGHNYLRKVIADSVELLNGRGMIFVGDVMDMELKEQLIHDLEAFKVQNKGKGYTTKTDFSADLFVAKGFFEDLILDQPGIAGVDIAGKIRTIENELTLYRYDALLQVDKSGVKDSNHKRNKYQYDSTILKAQPAHNPHLDILPSDLAYIIYTSGTTGRPKGSLIEHRNVVRLFKTDRPLFHFGEQDVWTLFHSYCFDFSVWEMYGALLFGGKLVIVPSSTAKDPALFRALLVEHQVTVLNQTPSAFYNLIREELESETSSLGIRCVIFGGEALSPGKLAGWKKRYPHTELINMYGITETTVHVTYKKLTDEDIAANSSNIGKPIPTLTCYVLDGNRQLLPIGVWGELYVGGEGVCRGYLNREELTAQRFLSSPFRTGERLYRTGDKARLTENGELEYGGRIDEQVKVRGYRIELGEIEHMLEQHGDIESAVVMARVGSDGEKELVAYVVSRETLSSADLSAYLGKTLPAFMLPSHYVQLDSLPLTVNGKVNRKALPDPEGLNMASGVDYVAPRNETEEKLVAIWQEVLRREHISVKDNFFDLGGHSLKVTRLSTQVHKVFEVKLALKDLFSMSVLEDQARFIESARPTSFASISPIAIQPHYALSPSQRRLWILSQFGEGNLAYNIPGAYLFEGELDRSALDYAFGELVARHEILRTVFRQDEGGEVAQFVRPAESLGFSIAFHDLRNSVEELDDLVKQELSAGFDLSGGPLLRAKLLQVSDSKWVFTYVMHHIISDGWSMNVLLKDLLALYKAYTTGASHVLMPLRIQYKDYAAWLQEQLSGENLATHKNYWLQQFEGELPVLELPGDRPRPAAKTYNGATLTGRIDATLVQGLKELAREQDATLFMALLAAINALLYRYTGQQDIITGTQIAGREHADLEDQIGMYLNTLALRARFSGEDNFIQLLENIKGVTLVAYEHQAYPFDELVDALNLQRDVSRNPLFDVSVVLHNTDALSGADSEESALRVTGYEGSPNLTSKFDLAFDLTETGGEIHLNLVYNTDIYSADTAQQLLRHLQQLLSALLAQPSTSINRLDYLAAEEKENLLKGFNNTKVDYPSGSSIARLFEEQATRTPEAIALVFGNKELTYRRLDEQSNRLAHHLVQQYRLHPGSFAGVLLDRSEQLMIAILAILKTGAAYVPIDPEYPTARKEFIINDTSIEVLLTQTDYLFDLGYYSGEVFAVDVQLDTLETSTASLSVNISSNDLAYVMYTSGSTGTPKGVMVEQRSVVRLVKNTNFVSFNPSDVLLSTGAVSFDATTFEYWGMLLNGGTLVLCGRETLLDAQRLTEEISSKRVNMMWFTAGWLNQLVEKDITVFDGLDTIVAGGDKLSPYHINALKLAYPSVKIINGYGPTENTTFSLTCEVPAGAERIPVGKPIHNSTAYILDALGQLVPVGVVGEICVGGDGLARGYLNNTELAEQKFIAHPFLAGARIYKTGDLGRWLPDGTIEFMGRRDEQVKIRGFRIEPGEIESVLQSHEAVEAAVVQVRTKEDEKELIAYIVNKQPVSMSDLRTYLSGLLPAYMIPAHFVQLDQLPLNANGKVDRKALPDPEGSERGVEYVAPRNAIEKKLVQIWQEVLGRETISVKDNFFEIGGHSLKATRLASQLHKELEVKVELKDLFSRMILEEQAELIAQAQKTAFTAIEPVALQESYGLSSSQRRLWVLSRFEEANIAYNMTGVFVLEGHLEKEALEYAFDTLIERHEILRTVFREDEQGEERQYVQSTAQSGFSILFHDLRTIEGQEEKLETLLGGMSNRPFDLSAGPLLRAELYRISKDKWVLSYVLHHIISDAWSMDILIRELLQLYNSRVEGTDNPLHPLRIQYKDYAAWQQQQLSGESLTNHKNYWLQQFEGELPVLELPTDRARPVVKTYNGGVVSATIHALVNRDLKALAQEQGGTLFMGLLAAVNVLLHRYTGQEDIIIGSPIAGRQHADLEEQIGFYLNTLALRSRFSGGQNFQQLLEKVKEVTMEAYEHQIYPFDELVDQLNLRRDMSRHPLFDVMVILQNAGGKSSGQNLGGLQVSGYKGAGQVVSKFDLLFNFTEQDEELRLDLEYNSDLYDRSTAERICAHLQQLLEAIAADPFAAITKLDYIGAEEKHLLLSDFNDTKVPYPTGQTLVDLFEEQVRQHPNGTALVFEQKTFTYEDLNQTANRLAHYLRSNYGTQPDDCVAVQLERSEWMVISVLAVLKSSAAYLPIDPEYPQERTDYIVADSGCKLVINETELARFREEEHSYHSTNPSPLNRSTDLAYVIYTSGSTGKPKGCMLEHRGVINRIGWMHDHYGYTSEDIILQKTTFTFDVSVWELFLPLCWGMKMVLCHKDDVAAPERIATLIEEQKVTCLHFVPGMLNAFIAALFDEENMVGRLNSLRLVVTSGEALTPATVQNWYEKLSTPLHNLYGPTEASIDVTWYAANAEDPVIPIGRPIRNTQMYVLDSHQALVPLGVGGEICIAGDGLARGYLNKPELTQEKFIAHPFKAGARIYRTGDWGRWLPDGNIEYLGRMDDQVKVRGYRIELGEIENALQSHSAIDAAVVVARADKQGEKELVAYIVSSASINITELRLHLGRTLPAYMVPAYFVQLEVLPLTSSGKVDRKALPDPDGSVMTMGVEYLAPGNAIEQKLVQMWQEILGREKIGVRDNFFDLGGHSLKATRLLAKIKKEFKVDLDLRNIFREPTIEVLSDIIINSKWFQHSEVEQEDEYEEEIKI